MKRFIILVLFIFLLSLVSSLNIEFSCPNSVNENTEFECSLKTDSSESYDVKVDITGEGKRISKLWNGESWKSSNYYLIAFIINQEKNIRVIINNYTGNSSGVLKLRKTGKTAIDFQKNISINVLASNSLEEVENIEKEIVEERSNETEEQEIDEPEVVDNINVEEVTSINSNTESIIKLNSNQEDKEIIYRSKDEIIKENLLIGFSIFLLIIIIILIIKK